MSQITEAVRVKDGTETTFPIHGRYDPKFECVAAAFIDNFTDTGMEVEEVGASACVIQEGEIVVDLWGGFQDREQQQEWHEDTLVAIRSNSKGICGVTANILADKGLLDLDAPVAKYWPEFAAAGKQDMPVRFILDHRAGLPILTEPLWRGAIYDWTAMTEALARQAPLWEPGKEAGYHTITQGYLIGEVVRRITGKTIGQVAREEIAEPLGADVYIGLRPDEEARCAEFLDVIEGTVYDPKSSVSLYAEKLRAQFPDGLQASTSEWRRSEVPSSNGHANARGIARMYSGVLGYGNKPLLSPGALARLRTVQHSLHESTGNRTIRQGMGLIINSPPWAYFGPNENAFGSHGFGGSLGMADPDRAMSISYTMNNPQKTLSTGPRSRRIVDATYAALTVPA